MMKFMLDSNVFDQIIADEAAEAGVKEAVSKGKIKIITTHIQEDELAEIPDALKREKISHIPREVVPTDGVVLGVSRYGMARLGGKNIEKIRQGNPRHTHDALIAATAHGDADILVTRDKTLISRVKKQKFKVDVWEPKQFIDYVHSL